MGVERKCGKKACTKCGALKPMHEFSRQYSTKDGRCYYCKKCSSAIALANYYKRKKLAAALAERELNDRLAAAVQRMAAGYARLMAQE
jgi:hypothetical protein